MPRDYDPEGGRRSRRPRYDVSDPYAWRPGDPKRRRDRDGASAGHLLWQRIVRTICRPLDGWTFDDVAFLGVVVAWVLVVIAGAALMVDIAVTSIMAAWGAL